MTSPGEARQPLVCPETNWSPLIQVWISNLNARRNKQDLCEFWAAKRHTHPSFVKGLAMFRIWTEKAAPHTSWEKSK